MLRWSPSSQFIWIWWIQQDEMCKCAGEGRSAGELQPYQERRFILWVRTLSSDCWLAFSKIDSIQTDNSVHLSHCGVDRKIWEIFLRPEILGPPFHLLFNAYSFCSKSVYPQTKRQTKNYSYVKFLICQEGNKILWKR